jgi:hypothetical protein
MAKTVTIYNLAREETTMLADTVNYQERGVEVIRNVPKDVNDGVDQQAATIISFFPYNSISQVEIVEFADEDIPF